MKVKIQTSIAYDFQSNRLPQNDDWIEEDIGHLPPEMTIEKITGFLKARHPKAFKFEIQTR